MILVLTGTHHQPFDRLVAAAGELARGGEPVVIQAGSSRLRPSGCVCVGIVPHAQLAAWADEARVIVSHAGPGSLFLAWERGKVPIVVPRRASLGEHVDDHQIAFAARLGERAYVVDDIATLGQALNEARGVLEPCSSSARLAFVESFDLLVAGVLARSRQRVWVDAVRRLVSRVGR